MTWLVEIEDVVSIEDVYDFTSTNEARGPFVKSLLGWKRIVNRRTRGMACTGESEWRTGSASPSVGANLRTKVPLITRGRRFLMSSMCQYDKPSD